MARYALLQLALLSAVAASTNHSWPAYKSLLAPPDNCPPCFNCQLPRFTCGQYGLCDEYDGQCKCPAGWGGIDCLIPQCDSLADQDQRRLREDGKSCDCKDGWGGINCNVCQSDQACAGFPLAGGIPDDDDIMRCYTGGETVFNNHQMCDVTNRKILDTVGTDRAVQVTFSCDTRDATCAFQFWVAEIESFYCALDDCKSSTTSSYDSNTTTYACEHMKCSCIPGRFICGEDGSVNIDDFLRDDIKGPAAFSCKSGSGCRFEEPEMNGLISDVFGDPYITLTCHGGECLHYSQVPGYERPPKPDNTLWAALSGAGAGLLVLVTCLIVWYAGRANRGGAIRLPDDDEQERLMNDHVPATLHFSDLSYTLSNGRVLLDGISGIVKPGEVCAIMGASGAGKSTLLDILARKAKRGTVSGRMEVNGRVVADREFRDVMGFVDQEDTLMSTLTVYETVLYSALLRLPREMSYAAKEMRTVETMSELGILGIRDSRVGESGRRSISGGEKRRVSIACELVTSPSILFLDEPTSGLDAYNAHNVIDALVSLARTYKRTVLFTIHQPRSNIVALGGASSLTSHARLLNSGGSNADDRGEKGANAFDMTMHAIMDNNNTNNGNNSIEGSPMLEPVSPTDDVANLGDEERGLVRMPLGAVRTASSSRATPSPPNNNGEEETELRTRPNSIADSSGGGAGMSTGNTSTTHARATSDASTGETGAGNYIKRKTSQFLDAISITSNRDGNSARLAPKLARLVDAYAESEIARGIREEGERLREAARGGVSGTASEQQLPDVALETSLLRGRKRASWGTQFRILSGRAFKNLYRDPALLTAHYTSSVALALICGLFFHNVTNDISGFQNRLGLFFFTLALFGFSCLTSLGLFANERILFIRERANGYYSTFTYFSSKVLFDILPLRVVPPIMFGAIVYGLVGLVPTVVAFWKFMLILVLFNLTTAAVVLFLSIAIASTSVAGLAGTLVMLFNLMFTGLLINRESVPEVLRWLHTISFFHAAFEALAVNELRYLHLTETKYGVELDVPAALILSTFGLHAQSFWWPNTALLGIFFTVLMAASYFTLHFFVKEKR
ncbi:hypothetical protein C8J57DRAFT_1348076 [Mycena rebaudengoi]|nr:hypothetical protein C8J57DRAFT_1348076 [Mycena rebaudengoi]